ncbi:DUF835 domain-containing protein [Thermococcus peptonophilus]|uniref:DUF835 domain-containing protein n=1 Tax=Thermococcus peptonophilus TaxID=53952 RepID=UPI000AB64369|nr:DUF835 domain-containing protein [Thermococcus peptonophilus]
MIWVSKIPGEYSGKIVPPKFVPELRGELLKFLKSAKENGKQGVVFVQNVCYLVVELGFKEAMDFLLYIKGWHYNKQRVHHSKRQSGCF